MPEKEIKIIPSPVISGCEAYATPKTHIPVDLFLDSNEGAEPDVELLDELKKPGIETLRRYPKPAGLEKQIAAMWGIDPGCVVVTAGADDAIERAMRSVLYSGRNMVLPVPTFEMLSRYAVLAGAEVREVEWTSGPFPLDAVLAAADENTTLVPVVSPNSPTGLVATARDLEMLASELAHALILVDLAYVEFADEDLTQKALEMPNAVVTRTFSKAWGLAGLRVGYALGRREVIDWIRAAGHPYSVSNPSVLMASKAMSTETGPGKSFIDRVRKERAELSGLLRELGAEVTPSQGNFVLASFSNAGWMWRALAGMGISVRIFPGNPYLENSLRISLPGKGGNFNRLKHAVETILAPEALLFDMDDTLADVTESYRQATVETAKFFGVSITFDDITAAKASGDANNDWELSRRLILNAGVEVTLEEVTEKFEEFYQGTDETEGMRKKEKLLIDRGTLETLARKYTLGVVTGRPKRDAMIFLEEKGIANLFSVVTTMEEGPPKPDPAPVRAAIDRLGVTRAWMLGDTPDDVRAARAAAVLPIGTVAPADDEAVASEAMTRAGAATVILKPSSIKELLP